MFAAVTDAFAVKQGDFFFTSTENTSTRGLVFGENDSITFHIDFQRVFFVDVQCAAEFDWNDNPTQFIDFAHNSS